MPSFDEWEVYHVSIAPFCSEIVVGRPVKISLPLRGPTDPLRRGAENGFASVPLHFIVWYVFYCASRAKAGSNRVWLSRTPFLLIELAWAKISQAETHAALLAMLVAKKQVRGSAIEIGSELYDSVFDSSEKVELKALGKATDKQGESYARAVTSLQAGSRFLIKLGYTLPALPNLTPRAVPASAKPKTVLDWVEYGLDRTKLKKLCPVAPGVRIQIDPKVRSTQAFLPTRRPGELEAHAGCVDAEEQDSTTRFPLGVEVTRDYDRGKMPIRLRSQRWRCDGIDKARASDKKQCLSILHRTPAP